MILVTVGTQKFPMNRLVEAADLLAEETGAEIFVQTGHSTYIPKYCKYSPFVEKSQFQEMIKNCELLITHSGVGSIMTGVRAGRPVIVVPRLKALKEHVDDNQQEIAEAFEEKNYVLYCRNLKDIPRMTEEAKTHKFDTFIECEGSMEDIILEFLETL